jgi:CRISPR-associated protein Cas2
LRRVRSRAWWCRILNMTARTLYIAGYDIADAKRLRLALAVLKEFSTGGQKSVFECFLTPAERQELLSRVSCILDNQEDRFLLIRLDPRAEVRTFGKAVVPENPPYFIIG